MTGQGGVPTVGSILLALLLCGLLGVLGQGVRAIVGLKNAGSLNSTTPTEQAEFSLAYLVLSLMIGFIAGILAGIALNLENIITVDPGNWKLLLGIAGSGYIGADFIENTMSVVIPGTRSATRSPPPVPLPPRPPTVPPAPEPRDGCLPLADAWDIDAITRRVNGDAMEAAGLRRQYSDEMVSRLRDYTSAAA
jgi:hypothetical protein